MRLPGLCSDLIDPAIAVHHGDIVKRTGDALIAEFRSVVDAVRRAIEGQNGMVERNAGVPEDRRIEFRIGVHLGDVVEEADGDLVSDSVNIAARLEGVAKSGAICLSEQAYWQVKGRLDLAVTDLGDQHLSVPVVSRRLAGYSAQRAGLRFAGTRVQVLAEASLETFSTPGGIAEKRARLPGSGSSFRIR